MHAQFVLCTMYLLNQCLSIINQFNNMERFLKLLAPGDMSSSSAKKPKSDAKQGVISPTFRALEFKAYFYDSAASMSHRCRKIFFAVPEG